jgi:hypothetical protein
MNWSKELLGVSQPDDRLYVVGGLEHLDYFSISYMGESFPLTDSMFFSKPSSILK